MIQRREFITGAAAAWPLAAGAQQRTLPVIAFFNGSSADASGGFVAAFRKGLGETGYVEGQNVTVEYHWLEGQYGRLPALMADMVSRRVAVIATPGLPPAAVAAKAATATIPIVFGVGEDPVKLGLVASLARPGGNATGINFFVQEVVAKRLGLLHELVPKAVRVAILVNPASATSAETTSRDAEQAARTIGLQTHVLNASTNREIDAVFATLARERTDALFVTGDAFFTSRRVQFANLAARDRIPATYGQRDYVAAGGLMSYGTDIADSFRQVGFYTGRILKMLWGDSGEHISIAALTNAMEPHGDETQNQDCERFQPVPRPAGYGRDVDRGDRDESIKLACCGDRSWCRTPAAEETRNRRTRIAGPVEPLAGGGREERPPDHTHRRGVRGRTRRLLAGALAHRPGGRGPRHSCIERCGNARTSSGEDRSARHGASQARFSRLAAR
jgi:putative ABC transport system substrate-binding protein